MQEQTVVAVRAAEAILSKKQKLEAVITAEVEKLPALISTRLETAATFRRLEAQASIGESAAGLPAIKKTAETARTALEAASVRLAGLRQTLADQAGDLAAVYDRMNAAIPGDNLAIIESFTTEWNSAAALWAETLGQRRGIEIGRAHV